VSEPRSVLVTGANQGIGAAIAARFLALGDKVSTIYHSGQDPAEGILGIVGDVTNTDTVEEAFKTIEAQNGPVEVLVANAGITRDQLLLRMTDAEFDSVLSVNLGGAFKCVRRASKGMIRLRRGRIVLISSVVGLYGSPGQANYAASKAGLVGMARSIARELGSRGITANVVAPGFVDTDMTRALAEPQREALAAQVPLGRLGRPEDIAAAVCFLAGPGAAWITGETLNVNGGMHMA
jgi:3-oxoacyl-[acyl-carrier protein] reductase